MAEADAGVKFQLGDRGPAITKLQKLLAKHHQATTDEGVFGEDTELKVRRFQMRNGIEATGVIDVETFMALQDEYRSGT